jgi:hypothetical protein
MTNRSDYQDFRCRAINLVKLPDNEGINLGKIMDLPKHCGSDTILLFPLYECKVNKPQAYITRGWADTALIDLKEIIRELNIPMPQFTPLSDLKDKFRLKPDICYDLIKWRYPDKSVQTQYNLFLTQEVKVLEYKFSPNKSNRLAILRQNFELAKYIYEYITLAEQVLELNGGSELEQRIEIPLSTKAFIQAFNKFQHKQNFTGELFVDNSALRKYGSFRQAYDGNQILQFRQQQYVDYERNRLIMLENSEQIRIYALIQYIFGKQMRESLMKIEKNQGEVFCWVIFHRIRPDYYQDIIREISFWLDMGFSGIRLEVDEGVTISPEILSRVNKFIFYNYPSVKTFMYIPRNITSEIKNLLLYEEIIPIVYLNEISDWEGFTNEVLLEISTNTFCIKKMRN